MTALGWLLTALAVLLSAVGTMLKVLDWLSEIGDEPSRRDWEFAGRCVDAIRRGCIRDCWVSGFAASVDSRPWLASLGIASALAGLMVIVGLAGQFVSLGADGLDQALVTAFLITLLVSVGLTMMAWRTILWGLFDRAPRRTGDWMIPVLLLFLCAASLSLPAIFVSVELVVRYQASSWLSDAYAVLRTALSDLSSPGAYMRSVLTHWLLAISCVLPLSIPVAALMLWSLMRLIATKRAQGLVEAIFARLLRSEQGVRGWGGWAFMGLGGILAGIASQVNS